MNESQKYLVLCWTIEYILYENVFGHRLLHWSDSILNPSNPGTWWYNFLSNWRTAFILFNKNTEVIFNGDGNEEEGKNKGLMKSEVAKSLTKFSWPDSRLYKICDSQPCGGCVEGETESSLFLRDLDLGGRWDFYVYQKRSEDDKIKRHCCGELREHKTQSSCP